MTISVAQLLVEKKIQLKVEAASYKLDNE